MWHKPKRPPSGAADVRAAGAEPPRPLHCTSMHCRPRTMDVQPQGCSSVCPPGLQSCSNPIFSSDAPVPSFWNRNAMFTLCCYRLGSVSFGVFVCFYSDSQIRIGCESGQCGTVQSTWTPEVVTELNAFHRSLMMTRAKRYALNVPSQALLCFGFCLFNCLCVVRFHCAAWLSQCPLCRPAWPQTCTSSSTSASITTPSSRLLIWTLGPHDAAALRKWGLAGAKVTQEDDACSCFLSCALKPPIFCPRTSFHCAAWLPTTKLFTLPWWPVGLRKTEVKINLPWLELLMSDILSQWGEKQLDTKLCLNAGSPVYWLGEHGQSNKLHSVLIP